MNRKETLIAVIYTVLILGVLIAPRIFVMLLGIGAAGILLFTALQMLVSVGIPVILLAIYPDYKKRPEWVSRLYYSCERFGDRYWPD